jgi:hypothetical protein
MSTASASIRAPSCVIAQPCVMAPKVDVQRIAALARAQDDVVTRAQLISVGATPDWMSRQVRQRRWQRIFPGVFVTHTGMPRWRTRARAALLYAGRGATLSHTSAAFHHGLVEKAGRVIHVSVPRGRNVSDQPGLKVVHRRRMPPSWGRLRTTGPIETVLDLCDMDGTTEDDVVGLVCRAVQRNCHPEHIAQAARRRTRLRHRKLVDELLAVVDAGVESPLEFRYHRIERAHGLPRSQLQVREVLDGLGLRADCRYIRFHLRVELDGQLAHPFGRTDDDVWRDNSVAILAHDLTLRYRWRHIVVTPCVVARQVVIALRSRGWTGTPEACGPGCAVAGLVRDA